MTILDIKQKRARLFGEQQAILAGAEGEGRPLSAEERAKWDAIEADFDALTATLEAKETAEKREKELTARDAAERATLGNEVVDEAEKRAADYESAFSSWLRAPEGMTALEPEQRAILRAGYREERAQAVGTGSAGGYLVPTGFRRTLIESMKWFGGMVGDEAPLTRIETAEGNDINVPTDDDTANSGAILDENAAISEQDLTLGQVTLKAYTYTSKLVKVSWQLLQDSAFDVDAWLANRLGKRIGRILNTHFTTGDNSSKPQGIVTASSVGKTGANGQTTTFIFEDLVDLEHSVDIAYRRSPNARFMLHDSTLKAAKKLKDSDGRPLWLPGVAVREPDTILGYRYIINNDMAAQAVSAKSILFGDFGQYLVRSVRDITLVRLNERYADSLQTGFFAFARFDGRMLDAGTDPVKHYANAAS